MKTFQDRREAGRELAGKLRKYRGEDDLLVLGLPRGGVPVAAEVAKELGAPLDVFVVRKLGVPGHEELALGAIASGGVRTLNRRVVNQLGIGGEEIERIAAREQAELERQERAYRGDRAPLEVAGKTVLLVDDGLATGATMRAAVRALREGKPSKVVVAAPTGAPDTCRELAAEADEVVCAMMPAQFRGVGRWYQDFTQTSDEEVEELLAQ